MANDTANVLAQSVRSLRFVLDDVPLETRFTLPSVGIDFGSAFVRTAVVKVHDAADAADPNSNAIAVDLATFDVKNVSAALQHAKVVYTAGHDEHEKLKKLGVYYTGHVNEERLRQVREAFPNAAVIERRDKLVCHNGGAQALIRSNLPSADLYHDTSEAERALSEFQTKVELFKLMLPPKLKETLNIIRSKMDAIPGKLPATLCILGSNVIVSKLHADTTFEVLDACSNGARSIEKFWRLADPERFTDFVTQLKLAAVGSPKNVDSVCSDVAEAVGFYSVMDPDYSIFNFGKMEKLSRHQVNAEDLARAVISLHTDLIFGKTFDFSILADAYDFYFSGSLVQHEFVRFDMIQRYNFLVTPEVRWPKFFKSDAIAALGACLAI